MKARAVGLLLQVEQASGLAGGCDFERVTFVVGAAAGGHAVDDAGELARGGDNALGLARACFETAAILADLVVAARDALRGQTQRTRHASDLLLQSRVDQGSWLLWGIDGASASLH